VQSKISDSSLCKTSYRKDLSRTQARRKNPFVATRHRKNHGLCVHRHAKERRFYMKDHNSPNYRSTMGWSNPVILNEFAPRDWFEQLKKVVRLKFSALWLKPGESKKNGQIFYVCESFGAKGKALEAILLRLAKDPRTSAKALEYISTGCSLAVAEAVATNEKSENTTLERLANHWSPAVRTAVAENNSTSFAILSFLSADENPAVRFSSANNHQRIRPLAAKMI
jgi:hypothetical protein